ncbi:uncharacterized protein LOC142584315 isoform X2 [Dermacentor variabilis]|uniref:uncharacterized protein LOC142584315 isoform X2 n=1 Tax=Dermacentor variabilis TaxID=34621 RepID=UPI003F5B798F
MLALGIFLMLASVRAISFEDAVGSYCCQKVQELMDLFSGMTFFEAVQIMCKASMDSSAAMFDDFITMNVAMRCVNFACALSLAAGNHAGRCSLKDLVDVSTKFYEFDSSLREIEFPLFLVCSN